MPHAFNLIGMVCDLSYSSSNHLNTWVTCKKTFFDCHQYLFISKIWIWIFLLLSWLFWLGSSASYTKLALWQDDEESINSSRCCGEVLTKMWHGHPTPETLHVYRNFETIKGASLQKKLKKMAQPRQRTVASKPVKLGKHTHGSAPHATSKQL